MRFKKVELSPANKRQYLIALSYPDIEVLLGETRAALAHTPQTPEGKIILSQLKQIRKGLAEALKVAKAERDDGKRVPSDLRARYAGQDSDENHLKGITRLEVIDHTPCDTCNGEMHCFVNDKMQVCPKCGGLGCPGRDVVFWDKNKEVSSSIQDDGRTLKLFIGKRSEQDT